MNVRFEISFTLVLIIMSKNVQLKTLGFLFTIVSVHAFRLKKNSVLWFAMEKPKEDWNKELARNARP